MYNVQPFKIVLVIFKARMSGKDFFSPKNIVTFLWQSPDKSSRSHISAVFHPGRTPLSGIMRSRHSLQCVPRWQQVSAFTGKIRVQLAMRISRHHGVKLYVPKNFTRPVQVKPIPSPQLMEVFGTTLFVSCWCWKKWGTGDFHWIRPFASGVNFSVWNN